MSGVGVDSGREIVANPELSKPPSAAIWSTQIMTSIAKSLADLCTCAFRKGSTRILERIGERSGWGVITIHGAS